MQQFLQFLVFDCSASVGMADLTRLRRVANSEHQFGGGPDRQFGNANFDRNLKKLGTA
jgi:hypothetical protein